MKENSRILIFIVFMFIIFSFSACSMPVSQIDLPNIFQNIWSGFSNIWEILQQSFENLLISIGNMFSGLSGVGEALRNMFRNFTIF